MARIICLANSYKHGGRCIAGIDQDTGKWIRPVPDSKGGAVTSAMRLIDGKEPQILEIIEIPIVDSHALTGVALTVSGFACPATSLLETAITPVFTGGELSLN
ncbi:MAG: hypothetical protein MUP16_07945 [Sedimentisphaerales bacterium]|jgi:hypothetical protein|nr:hypothetical protein [Sedimentisphaerales bacterium]